VEKLRGRILTNQGGMRRGSGENVNNSKLHRHKLESCKISVAPARSLSHPTWACQLTMNC